MASWSIELPNGTEYALSVANGIAFRGAVGHRMAPVRNVTTPYALVDGALYQRTQVMPRVLTLLIDAIGTSEATLVALEDALVAATNPHRPTLPIKVWYRSGGAGTGMYINARYEGGLDGGIPNGFVTDNIPMRFLCTDPYWHGETDVALGWELDDGILLDDGYVLDDLGALFVYDSMAVANRIIERDADGNWTNLDGGASGNIYCMAIAPNGDIYVGGAMHSVGTGGSFLAVQHIAMWDGAWHALGAGVDDIVYAMAFDAAGNLYVGGNCHNAGAGAALHIAKWTVATTTWSAVGAGLDDDVRAIAVAPNGDVYTGGAFHNVAGGGIAVAHIAMWDVSATAWVAVGAGFNVDVATLAVAPNGDVYAGGSFTSVGGGGITVNYIAKWNGAWSALGAGLSNIVLDIAIAPNGEVYATGQFTSVSGGINVWYIAKWNGAAWSALGSGLDDYGIRIDCAANGDVYVAGNFTLAGGLSVPAKWATWSNGVWLPGWAGTLNGMVYEFAVSATRTILAGAFTAATVPGHTLIDNLGSANGYPVITITGPGRLFYLINYTTGQVIYLDITLMAGEVLTINLSGQNKTITSSFRGGMFPGIIAGTLTNWYLQPGDNYIGCYVDNSAATGSYTYSPLYWGSA